MTTSTRLNVARAMEAQARMLDRQRQGLGVLCALGVPGAWQVLTAIHGDKPEVK